jgi:hypothetical protein
MSFTYKNPKLNKNINNNNARSVNSDPGSVGASPRASVMNFYKLPSAQKAAPAPVAPTKRLTWKNKLRSLPVKLGLRQNRSQPVVKEQSARASEWRARADTISTLGFVAAGILNVLAAVSAPIPPASVSFLALSMLTQRVMSQTGINLELRSNLIIIQHETDRFSKIMKVMQDIAAENGIELNTGSVSVFVTKITSFIALLADDNVIQEIKVYRQSSQENPMQALYANEGNGKAISTWGGKFKRMFAPTEYLRQLVRDITILSVFMNILLGEFDLFMRYKGDPTKKGWSQKPAFQSMLFDTMRLSGILPKAAEEKESDYIQRQLATMNAKMVKGPYAEFYQGLKPQRNALQALQQTRLQSEMIPKKKSWFGRGGEPTAEELAQATQFLTTIVPAAKQLADAPQLVDELKEHEKAEVAEVAAAVKQETLEKIVLGEEGDATLEEGAEEIAQGIVNETMDPNRVNQAVSAVAQTITNQKGGKQKTRRTIPIGRSRKLKKTIRRRK